MLVFGRILVLILGDEHDEPVVLEDPTRPTPSNQQANRPFTRDLVIHHGGASKQEGWAGLQGRVESTT